jgi:hypothetical protein
MRYPVDEFSKVEHGKSWNTSTSVYYQYVSVMKYIGILAVRGRHDVCR